MGVGGGGGPGPTARKQSGQPFFFILVLNLFYSLQRGPNGFMVLLQRKLYFSKGPEWVQHFPGEGSPLFSRGVGSKY